MCPWCAPTKRKEADVTRGPTTPAHKHSDSRGQVVPLPGVLGERVGARARNVHAINQCASSVRPIWPPLGSDWPMAPQSKPRGSNGCMSPIWGRRREPAQRPHTRTTLVAWDEPWPHLTGRGRAHSQPQVRAFSLTVGKQRASESAVTPLRRGMVARPGLECVSDR